MDAAGHPLGQGIINEPMSRHPAEACKALTADAHGEVSALACSCMAGVQVAVVDDRQFHRGQRSPQAGLNLVCSGGLGCRSRGSLNCGVRIRLGHGGTFAQDRSPEELRWSAPEVSEPGSRWRLIHKPCTTMNTSIRPMPPKSLKFTQVEVSKL